MVDLTKCESQLIKLVYSYIVRNWPLALSVTIITTY